jgi:hypothetical protein
MTLETARAEVEAKLAKLKLSPEAARLVREADRAVAAHRAEADALERDLAEIDAQLGVREKDRREAAAREREAHWQAQRQALVEENDAVLKHVDEMERATRTFVAAFENLLAADARRTKIAQDLADNKKVPRALNQFDLVRRTSMRFASVMSTIRGHRFRLGALEWPSGASGLYPADQSWRASEEQFVAAAVLQPLLETGKA